MCKCIFTPHVTAGLYTHICDIYIYIHICKEYIHIYERNIYICILDSAGWCIHMYIYIEIDRYKKI